MGRIIQFIYCDHWDQISRLVRLLKTNDKSHWGGILHLSMFIVASMPTICSCKFIPERTEHYHIIITAVLAKKVKEDFDTTKICIVFLIFNSDLGYDLKSSYIQHSTILQ